MSSNKLEILSSKMTSHMHKPKPFVKGNEIVYLEPIEMPEMDLTVEGLVSATETLIKAKLSQKNESYVLDIANGPVIRKMAETLLDAKGKGVYLYGDNSRGKSLVMSCMLEAIRRAYSEYKVSNVPQVSWRKKYRQENRELIIKTIRYDIDVEMRSKNDGSIGWMQSELADGLTPDIIYLDDIGYGEEGNVQTTLFGNKEKLLAKVTSALYSQYNRGTRIVMTSNIMPSELYELFGDDPGKTGPSDRIIEMCVPLLWSGSNLRNPKKK